MRGFTVLELLVFVLAITAFVIFCLLLFSLVVASKEVWNEPNLPRAILLAAIIHPIASWSLGSPYSFRSKKEEG